MAEKGLVSAPNAAVGAPFQIGGQPPVGFYNVDRRNGSRQVTTDVRRYRARWRRSPSTCSTVGAIISIGSKTICAPTIRRFARKVGWLLGRGARGGRARRKRLAARQPAARRRAKSRVPIPPRSRRRNGWRAISREIGALEGQIRAQPVPEADHMTDRYRREAETLHALLQCDLALVGRAEALRAMLADADAAAMLARETRSRAD